MKSEFLRTFRNAIISGLFAVTSLTTELQAAEVEDSDGDGLTTAVETTLGTDPVRFDTDGDGLGDGAEVRAGTNPKAAGSVFKILGTPVRVSSGWEISWNSVPGRSYRLQRTDGDGAVNAVWIDIQTVNASGATAVGVDAAAGASKRFYRVVLVETTNQDNTPPVVSNIIASPTDLQSEGSVTLSVNAQDASGVASVDFFDGVNLLGSATRVDGDLWRVLWPVTVEQNGIRSLTARATDQAGNATTSAALPFTVAIMTVQEQLTIGQTTVQADNVQTNGTVVSASGNLRIGLATFSADTSLSFNATEGTLTGQGTVTLAGVGEVINGAFSIEASTSVLIPASLPSEINLNSETAISAAELKINLRTGAMEGKGTITLSPTGGSLQAQSTTQQPRSQDFGPVTFTGEFRFDPQARSLTVAGSAAFGPVVGTGTATILLADSTFTLPGELRISSGDSAVSYTLNDATFQLRKNANQVDFSISGKPTLPPLAQLALTLTGTMDLVGNINLTGTANGEVGPVSFSPVTVTLQRDSLTRLVDVKYRGNLQVQALPSPLELFGHILPDGRVTLPELQGELDLGGNVSIRPKSNTPTKLRVSVKFILNSLNQRPSGNLSTDQHVREQIRLGNEMLAGAGNQYQLDLIDIVNVSGASSWFDGDARSGNVRKGLQEAALLNPVQYGLRADAVNIYINGNDSSGNAPPEFPDQIILIGQGGRATTIPHEIGHYFGLAHTQGANCGGCNDPIESISCMEPGDDGIDDTLPDLECWTQDQIAQRGFSRDYGSLSAAGKEQVDLVFFNLMSYHGVRNRLSAGQVERITSNVNGARFHVADGTSVLELLAHTASGLEFALAGEGSFSSTVGERTVEIDGMVTVGKNGSAFQVNAALPPLDFGDFRLESATGGDLTASIGSTGIKISPGARITHKGQPLTLPALPEFIIPPSGTFSIEVTASMTAGLKFQELSLLDAGFTFQVSGGTGTIQRLKGSVGLNALGLRTPITLNGEFSLDPAAQTVSFTGSASYAGVTGTGATTVSLSDRTFTVVGQVRIESGSAGQSVVLREAIFQMRIGANGQPEFIVKGTPELSVLAQLRVTFDGGMDANGNLSLRAEANGALGAFSFNPVTVTLQRNGGDGARVALKYRGSFQVQGLAPLSLSGQIQLDGRISPPEFEGSLNIGTQIQVSPRANTPTKLRVSVKFILDAAGQRPRALMNQDGQLLGTPVVSEQDVREQLRLGNEILARSGNRFQFELVDVVDVSGASEWFNVDARSAGDRLKLQNAALLDQQRYAFRWDAVNIYINGSSGSGNSAVVLPDQIIFMGQGGQSTTIPHELGHYFGLWHTQGRLCGGCKEAPAAVAPFLRDVPVLGGLCSTEPDTDEIADTLEDIECWDQNQIAERNFNLSYAGLSLNQKAQVDAVFFNLMSYHKSGRDRLTVGQVDRIALNANGPRFHVADNPTVLDLISENSGKFEFVVAGDFQLNTRNSSRTIAVAGTMSIEKTTNGFEVTAFSAASASAALTLEFPGGIIVQNATVTLEQSASGAFEVTVDGQVVFGGDTLNVTGKVSNGAVVLSTTLSPLVFGEFRLESTAPGGAFTASVSATGVTIPAGARLLYKGEAITTPTLPQITLSETGFSVTATTSMTAGLKLNGFGLSNSTFTFRVVGGVASIQDFSGSLLIPGMTAAQSVGLAGSLDSVGNFSLTGRAAAALSFTELPISPLDVGATVTLSNNGLSVSGKLTGPIFARYELQPPPVTLQVSAAGAVNITAGASVTLPPIVLGAFRLESTAVGGAFTASLTPTGIRIPTGARLLFRLAEAASAGNLAEFNQLAHELSSPSSPGTTLTESGFSMTVTSSMTAGLKLNGFDLINSTFTFRVLGGVASIEDFRGSLVIPGMSAAQSVAVAGSLDSEGNFSLTGTAAAGLSFTALPISPLKAGATVTLNNDGLSISGELTGPVFARYELPPPPVTLKVSASGAVDITAGASVTLPPIVLGAFRLESTAVGGAFTASLTPTGIRIPTGARLLYRGVAITTATLPEIALAETGFSVTATTSMTTGLKLNNFNLSDSTFTFRVEGGVASIQDFSGSLLIPGMTAAQSVGLTGSLDSIGNFTLTGRAAAALSFTQLPISPLNAGATVTLNNDGLSISGNLSGPVFARYGLLPPPVTLQVSAAGAVNITAGASVTLPPIVMGEFRLESTAAGGAFAAGLTPTGIRIPEGARLYLKQLQALTTATLPPITITESGFSVTATTSMTTGLRLDGFDFRDSTFTFSSVGGVASVQNFRGTVPVASGPALPFSGSISSDGTIAFSSAISAGATLNQFPIRGSAQFVSGPSRYRASVSLNNPYAHWRLGEKPDKFGIIALAKDEEVGHDGILSQTQWSATTGAIGGDANSAFNFSGNDQIPVSASPNFNVFSAFTLEAWIKVDQFTSAYQSIFTKGDSAWRIQRNATQNSLSFDTDGLNPPHMAGTTSVADNQWHHVVAVYDGTKKYLYIDGKLDASQTVTGTPAGNNYDVLIGANSQQAGRNWFGAIDEVAFYKQALSHDDIVRHYVAAKGHALSAALRFQHGSLANVDLRGYISSSGAISLSGVASSDLTLAGFGFSAGKLGFERPAGGIAELAFSGGLNIKPLGSALSIAPTFSGTINSGGTARLRADNVGLNILNYEFAEVDFDLTGAVTGTSTISWMNGLLHTSRFDFMNGQRLGGTLSNSGVLNMSRTITLDYGGFAANCTMTLKSGEGLRASGTFDLGIGQLGGSAIFSGLIGTDGTRSLQSGINGSLTFSGFAFRYSDALTLSSTGVSGRGALDYGYVHSFGDFSARKSTGAVSFTGTVSNTTDWFPFGLQPNGSPGHPKANFNWRVNAGFNGSAINASVSGTLTVEYECFTCFDDTRTPTNERFPRQSFFMSSRAFGSDGKVSLTPGGSFNNVSTFVFGLPNRKW